MADQSMLNTPNEPAAWHAEYKLRIQGQEIIFTRPVWHRYVDRVYGELLRPLLFVPPAVVALGEKAFVFPTSQPKKITALVTAMSAGVRGDVKLTVPPVGPCNRPPFPSR